MVLDGYDNIIEISDADGTNITKVARSRGHFELASYLDTIRQFEVNLIFHYFDLKLDC